MFLLRSLVLRMSACTWIGGNKPPKRMRSSRLADTRGQLVGVIHFLPVQRACAEGLIVCLGRHSYVLSCSPNSFGAQA